MILKWWVQTRVEPHYLNLLKCMQRAESVSLVTMVKDRDKLGHDAPHSTIPVSLLCNHDHMPDSGKCCYTATAVCRCVLKLFTIVQNELAVMQKLGVIDERCMV